MAMNELNALSIGVSPDGLKNRTSIKVLVCGMLSRVDGSLDRKGLIDVIYGRSLANYMELCSAIEELRQSGNIAEREDGSLFATDEGRAASDELWAELPLTVREKAIAAAEKYCSRLRSERDNTFSVEELEHGCRVRCSINDGGEELMGISFYLPNKSYVKAVRERFYSEPEYIYQMILAQLTGDSSIAPES